jgi:hypothetical protein
MVKTCSCGTKETSRWYQNGTQCASYNKKIWYQKNKEKSLLKNKEWNSNNVGRKDILNKIWYINNKEHRLNKNVQFKKLNPNYTNKWKLNNVGKTNYYAAKYRANKLNATLNGFDDAIEIIYQKAKDMQSQDLIPREVHHSIPLQQYEDIVCGLHVPWNLEVLTEDEHRKAHEELWKVYGRNGSGS